MHVTDFLNVLKSNSAEKNNLLQVRHGLLPTCEFGL